jgi:hypothetical protein
LIEEIQNQGSNRKGRVIVVAEIDQIRGQIKENQKFDGHLRV